MIKKLLPMALSAIIFLISFQNIYAVKAIKTPITITQPDGSKVTVILHGDEFHHFRTTEDGYVVKENASGFLTYATVQNGGTLKESNVIAKNPSNRSASDIQFLSAIDKTQSVQQLQKAPMRSKMKATSTQPRKAYPLNGSPKSLVILVNFSDKSYVVSTPQTAFTNLLNQDGYTTNGGTGSARDYFMSASYGKFSPNFDVVGPFTLPQTLDYYGKNDTDGYDTNPLQMIIDACSAANSTVDFTQYDTDNDGVIDNVFVYYAGYNEAENAAANTIWPHRWGVYPQALFPDGYNYTGTVASVTFDGKRLMDYACTSELKGTSGSNMCGIGTFSHEFGHVLGLPDYYNTDDSNKNTLNEWHIMDSGAYNNEGRTPPTYTSFDRFFLGWITPEQVSTPIDLTLLPLYQGKTTPANTNQQTYLFSASTHNLVATNPDPKEFFMVEYRKKTGWDAYLPAEGLLIWHIDYDQTAWDNNGPNNYTGSTQTSTDHMRLYLQPLSGSTTTPGTAFTSGSFTPTTWSGTDINRAITSIALNADNVTFKLMGGTQGPTINTAGSIVEFSTVFGTASSSQTLTVSGTTLTNDILLSFDNQTNFEMKLSSQSTWSKSLTIPQVSGAVAATTVNIRYNPAAAGSHNAVLTLASTGATSKTVNLSGSASVPFDPNATAVFPGKIDNALQFPATTINRTRTKVLNIKTTDVLSALSVNLTGTNASMFTVSTNQITNIASNAANGTNINITYTPTATGTHTAVLTISGGGLNPAKVINLTGEGK